MEDDDGEWKMTSMTLTTSRRDPTLAPALVPKDGSRLRDAGDEAPPILDPSGCCGPI